LTVEVRAPTPTGNSLLFRFGFICHSAAHHPEGDRVWAEVVQSWRTLEVAGFVIHHHPETLLRHHRRDGGAAVLIGDAFATPPGRTVESVLDTLLAAESDDLFFDSFDALSGRFALLVLKGSARRAFHDPIGSRSLFYRGAGEFCLGSHAELIAHAFGMGKSEAVQELIGTAEYESRTVKYLPGDLTLYEDLHGLAPNNYYDITERRSVRYWPRQGRRSTTFDEFFGALDEYLAALASHLRGRYSPILGVTGGIDTRTLLAAFSRYELPVRGVTWLRRRRGPQEDELRLVEALTAQAGIEHTYLRPGPADDGQRAVRAIAKRNLGGFGRASRITAQMHERFAQADAVFVRGYGAEIIRGFYNFRNPNPRALRGHPVRRRLRAWSGAVRGLAPNARRGVIGAMTAGELLTAYDSSMRGVRAGEEHRRLGLAAFEGFIERANYDERLVRLGFDLDDLFYWEHRMGMWGSAKHNEMDPAALSISGFNDRSVYEIAFGMNPRERLTKELLLRVVRRYDERMAAIPYL
jgi:asparagine synthetase B (glutamine-hydrolysing)